MSQQQVKEKVIDMLAYIYGSVPWGKMKTRHNVWDIFNHRVRAASRRATLGQFISKLCNYFGLQQAPPDAIRLLEELQENETEALNLIYSEHIYISMQAILKSKKWKEEKKKKDNGTLDLFEGEKK